MKLIKNKFFLLIIGLVLVSFFVLFYLLLSGKSGKTETPQLYPTPTQYPLPSTTQRDTPGVTTKISPLQRTIIGKTSDSEIEKHPDLQKKNVLPDGHTEYSFPSKVISRPNIIITSGGVAVFERIWTLSNNDPTSPIFIKDYKRLYGEPDKIIRGSYEYGWFAETHIYSTRGFAFIGNPYTDEVYELQVFEPMSVDDYGKSYGVDLNPGAQPPQEGLPQ